VDDELRQGCVERSVGKRQLLGGGLLHAHLRIALARRCDERLGGIDGRYGLRPEPCHQLGRERARPAAHVEHALAGTDAGEVGELRREQHRVPAHEAVVRVGRDGEEAHPAER
jgi:hypothetical protein